MRRTVVRALTGTGIAAVLVLSSAVASGAAIDQNRDSRTVMGVGSDTTYEVMNDLDQVYNESAGCAVIPDVGGTFTNYQEHCIIGGSLAYSTNVNAVIDTENLYHDRIIEAYPVGSSNGRRILEQKLAGTPALDADFSRASSKQTFTLPAGFTAYGVAYGRDASSVWLGNSNTLVAQVNGNPAGNFKVADLKTTFVGNAGGQCTTKYATATGDSIQTFLGAPGSGSIVPFATQAGSGSGLDFLRLIDPSTSYSLATALQNCIPAQFKDGAGNDDHVIFENNAGPICSTGGTNFSNKAIYPYAFSRFTQNKGGTGPCPGTLQKVGGVKPTITSIGGGTFPFAAYRYNYVVVPNAIDVNDPTTWTGQTRSVLEYLHPTLGWLCKPSGQHSNNPISAQNYRTQIENTMKADGVSPIGLGPVGGSTFAGSSHCRDAAAV